MTGCKTAPKGKRLHKGRQPYFGRVAGASRLVEALCGYGRTNRGFGSRAHGAFAVAGARRGHRLLNSKLNGNHVVETGGATR